ncbi:putative fatty acyl-CoA reductase, partial [Stegodyphus mimosarum]
MESQQRQELTVYSRVADFYQGKSVFITGAAGYLGVILLEILLRCCPGIRCIYILLREKKGVEPEFRLKSIFKREVFNKLKEKQPDVLQKVKVVSGDISLPNLGMSKEDELDVATEASIVFHCAAIINFLKPLKYILLHNAVGTANVIDFCKKLKKIDALVYTSTAYSNSNRNAEIEEQIYRLPFPSQRFLDVLSNGSDEDLRNLVSQCYPKWPNTYTFSKCLAENILAEQAADFPVSIIRPSIIVSCWKGALP